MKLKSLILGSVAAAGLSTAGFAADLGVLTSLDVCDELGLSGLTISSDTNCLQISGEVKYEFSWGNYDGVFPLGAADRGVIDRDAPNTVAGVSNDWSSKVESWLKFVGTAGSDFGPASVVIKIKEVRHEIATNGVQAAGGDAAAINFDEAYVSVGDTTVLAAGKKGSIFNKDTDEPYNFTGLFISELNDTGVEDGGVVGLATGGHVIQLWSNFADGVIGKIGLEDLEDAGTLVGVLDYSGAGFKGHISGAVGGILDGVASAEDAYVVHAGFEGTFDQFKLLAAFSAGNNDFLGTNFWNGLISGQATFDMFKIALSAEAYDDEDASGADYGFGGSIGATVAEGIEINIGGRYFVDGDVDPDVYQVAAQLKAALTETVTMTAEIGVFGNDVPTSDFYGKAELGWKPGGGFESSVGATVQQNGAYKVTFKASKAFQ